jgi:2-(3-amino-3-carboxypropyl)histidine synthase
VANAEPCFGACDLALKEAEMLNAGLIVHFGHSDFRVKSKKSVIYWPVEARFDEARVAEKIAEICRERNWFRTGLGTTIQYLPAMKKMEKLLAEKEIKAYSVQVLGCNYTAVKKLESKVDGFLFLGDGLFHALGMQFAVGKKVLALNPQTLTVKELNSEKDSYYGQRISQISIAKQARTFAILVSTKPGQFNITLALKAKQLIESSGRKAFLFYANFLKAEFFAGLQFDCFVNTACPRIAIDDSSQFAKPVLNFKELEIALGKRRLEEFK